MRKREMSNRRGEQTNESGSCENKSHSVNIVQFALRSVPETFCVNKIL